MTTFHPGGGGSSLTSGHAELVSASHNKEIPKHLTASPTDTGSHNSCLVGSLCKVRNDKYVSEAHSKELNVLMSYRLNDFKKKVAFTLAEGATQRICTRTERSEFVPASKTTLLRAVHNPRHVDMSDNIRRVAFTLAEVLITLAIIGVVAAMTIPTLIANYQEKQTVTQLTKAYSMLSQAVQLMYAEYGPITTWGLSKTDTGKVDEDTGEHIYDRSAQNLLTERLKKYLKVAKVCEQGKICRKGAVYLLDGTLFSDKNLVEKDDASSKFFLQDGTLVSSGWFQETYSDIAVILPIGDGDAILGKNYFYFDLTDKGLFPKGMQNPASDDEFTFENDCNPESTSYGYGCTAWVIYNKNMDYLHCFNELDWNGAHSCKEAK